MHKRGSEGLVANHKTFEPGEGLLYLLSSSYCIAFCGWAATRAGRQPGGGAAARRVGGNPGVGRQPGGGAAARGWGLGGGWAATRGWGGSPEGDVGQCFLFSNTLHWQPTGKHELLVCTA